MKYVLGFMFAKDKKRVVLIRKNKPLWQSGKLNGVGGKIEDNENPLQAMIREFEEEVGVKTVETDWNYVCKMHRTTDEEFVCFVFSSFKLDENKPQSLTEELVSIYNLIYNGSVVYTNLPIISNLQWLIPLCLDTNDGISMYRIEGVVGK